MASGGGDGFYGGGGRPMVGNSFLNAGGNQYRYQQQQFGGGLADPAAQIGYRRPDFQMIGKRSLADYRSPQPSLFQQQQQQGLYMRSVKQRTGGGFNGGFQNHALSPISPLSASIDLCFPTNGFDHSPSLSTARYGVPIYPHRHRHHQQQQPGPVSAIHNNPGLVLNPGSDISNKVMTLRELEKQLLDDDDEDNNGGEEDAVSAITNSDWSETFQDLISPKPGPTITNPNIPASATTAANTTSLSPASSSSSSCSSSKTPPPPPPPAAKPAHLISEAAAAIVDGKSEECAHVLSRLSKVVSPTGYPEQRLGFYMLHALRCRLSPDENPPPIAELYNTNHLAALHALYDVSPYFKYALLSSNLIILDVIASAIRSDNNGGDKKVVVHILDFDIGNGKQYINLIRDLISQIRPGGVPLELKITAVETEHRIDNEAPKRLGAVGNTLMRLVAEKDTGRISFRFNAVTLAVDELTRESLSCDAGEALVVNFAFRLFRVPDESVSMDNLRDALLRRVRAMEPRVVTLAEQELNANTAPFASRVSECAAYYGALLDSLDLAPDRARVEEAIGRKMSNAIACEGRQRIERCEVYGKWRARMSMAGFKPKPVGSALAGSMWENLSNPARGGNPNFTVKEENGGVCFGWMGKTLTVASAWR